MYIKARPILVETDKTSIFIQNAISEYLYSNKGGVNIKYPKYVDLFLTYMEQDFKEGEELTHRISGEKHTFIKWHGDMLITQYETEIGKGESWTDRDLLHFNEQIIATSNKTFDYPIIPANFLTNYRYNNNKIDREPIEIIDVAVGLIDQYRDGMEFFCTHCNKNENECECNNDFYIKTEYPNNTVLLKNEIVWNDSDMIAFAKYAKNYYTPREVEIAFETWKEKK